ncbi:SDR family NAD(P)-dependent oxidoreductase [Alkalilimnicola ehrlichii MLHE-1]|uniref:Short-chain dehydrogenase/reductase SDR n=1 Tax=Alkalilimnicola ehrlichii (strain ATCC BAA-1101 / DSM 17681 / MLHE-1) TaxID=187272 RepID=Q0AA78_ALKEH|nr:SDR family NAD(P)-dependent oxidoreductase [Alkalilimnicola ehrlichii]ABI56259.1 short-chain dehydrogenase/reductase SDR [Alkalilimnicola ehrlichii MLHE-1]
MSNPLTGDYTPAAELFRDRIILVTGACGGIGGAVCRQLAEAGATVVALDKDMKSLERLYDDLAQRGPAEPALYPMNLEGASTADYDDMRVRLEENFGRLDGLLHCAAMLGRPAPVEIYDMEAWFRTVHLNLHAPFLVTRACLPLLRQSPAASIVFTSAREGREQMPYAGAYGVSAAGVEGLMRILAAELADTTPVRVNSLDPGAVRTRMRYQAYPGEDQEKLPTPDQVAGAFVWLLGADSADVHGQSLTLAR